MGDLGSRISLLEADPDLARFLPADEQHAAAQVTVPIIAVRRGDLDLHAVLENAHAFGALVIEGMLFGRHRAGDRTALRLLGRGDLLALPGAWRSAILPDSTLSAAASTKLAVLGTEVLRAVGRWPRLMAGLYVRVAEQSDRVAAQLTICQIPRVDERLLAMMWLLADSWGHVGSAGTRLPLNLTHDVLGGLVGARRPTVTLALGELTERGAIVRQDQGWLLLEAPVELPQTPPAPPDHDVLIDQPPSVWRPPEAPAASGDMHEQLLTTVDRLRREHLASREAVRARLAELTAVRTRSSERRRRIAEDAVRRRGDPS